MLVQYGDSEGQRKPKGVAAVVALGMIGNPGHEDYS